MSEPIKPKQCSKCKEIKPIDNYYKHSGICKNCIYLSHQTPEYKDYQAKYRKTEGCKKSQAKHRKTQKYKDTQKRHRQTTKYRETIKRLHETEQYKKKAKEKRIKYDSTHREIRAVHQATHRAVDSGKLPRPDTLICHYCGNPAIQYHHHNGYDKEHRFDVVPVCCKCHKHIHHYGLSSSGTKPVTEPLNMVLSEVPEETEP